MANNLKLGVIGLSEGNGHPYSWSAICNGYDDIAMRKCPFPVIYEYLAEEKFPQARLKGMEVTHIWTQDKKVSQDVAKAANIPHVVDKYQDIIGKVDAILLARDDAQNHLQMSQDFITAGLPIYIDKPLAFTITEAQEILELEQYPGQIFTCTALAYAKELVLSARSKKDLGKIKNITATTVKKWSTYSTHIIEPVLKIVGDWHETSSYSCHIKDNRHELTVNWPHTCPVTFISTGQDKGKIEIEIFGSKKNVALTFTDTFSAFKSALETFRDVVTKKTAPPSHQHFLVVVDLIEKGSHATD